MRKPFALGVITLAVTLSLGLAACGSSSDDSLSNDELITQADQICTDYNDKLVTLTDNAGLDDNSSKQEVVAFISDEIVPLYENQVDELRALEPNEDDADAYNDIVTTLDTELQAVKDDPAAAMKMNDPFPEATAKAKDFGLTVCGAS